MPCSNCRTHYSLNPHENTSFLWSSKSLIDSISFTTTEKSSEIPPIKSIDWNDNLKRIRQNNKSYPVIENEEKILFDELQNLNIPNGNYSIYKYKKPKLIGDLTVNENKVSSLELNYGEEISWNKLIYSELDLVIILR